MKKVIFFDNDVTILRLIKYITKDMDLDFISFSDVKNIESVLTEHKPDLILMDLQIPHIGGEESVRLIKKNRALQHIPVLLFSADVNIKEIYQDCGADGYIPKPFEVPDFKEILNCYLKRVSV